MFLLLQLGMSLICFLVGTGVVHIFVIKFSFFWHVTWTDVPRSWFPCKSHRKSHTFKSSRAQHQNQVFLTFSIYAHQARWLNTKTFMGGAHQKKRFKEIVNTNGDIVLLKTHIFVCFEFVCHRLFYSKKNVQKMMFIRQNLNIIYAQKIDQLWHIMNKYRLAKNIYPKLKFGNLQNCFCNLSKCLKNMFLEKKLRDISIILKSFKKYRYVFKTRKSKALKDNFWYKFDTFWESPETHFKHIKTPKKLTIFWHQNQSFCIFKNL